MSDTKALNKELIGLVSAIAKLEATGEGYEKNLQALETKLIGNGGLEGRIRALENICQAEFVHSRLMRTVGSWIIPALISGGIAWALQR